MPRLHPALARRPLRLAVALVASASLAPGAGAQGNPPIGQLGCEHGSAPSFRPWFYRGKYLDDFNMTWGFHLHYEDPGYPIRVLSGDFYDLPSSSYPQAAQNTDYVDLVVLNRPHFDPPEGIELGQGQSRRIQLGSLVHRGIQLLVNCSNAYKDDAGPEDLFIEPSFFVATEGVGFPTVQNDQIEPALTSSGMSSIGSETESIAASGGAVGTYFDKLGNEYQAIYVTAGLGVPLSEIDSQQAATAALLQVDRLLVRSTGNQWIDLVALYDQAMPAFYDGLQLDLRAAAEGASAGVAFGDFDGDGDVDDLYVGKPGADLEGAPDVLLINEDGLFVDHTAWIDSVPSGCTADVAAGRVDPNATWEIVVANRVGTGDGTESEDQILVRTGPTSFTAVDLNAGQVTDSRSVALGNLGDLFGAQGYREIVFGEAGSDPFADTPLLAGEATLQLFYWDPVGAAFTALAGDAISADLARGTQPHTRQVLVADLFGPSAGTEPRDPDGLADLVVVNCRDGLKHDWSSTIGDDPIAPAGNVSFFTNLGNTSPDAQNPLFELSGNGSEDFTLDVPWTTCIALADTSPSHPALDIYHARGNRYNGVMPHFTRNLESSGSESLPWDLNDQFQNHLRYDLLPATEHGYGLDFADYDEDGLLDAVQTSRGYNYLVNGLNHSAHYRQMHEELVPVPVAPDKDELRNDRGRLIPRAGEDAAFADLDNDGDLDLALVIQTEHSPDHVDSAGGDRSPDTVILRADSGAFEFDKDFVPTTHAWHDVTVDLSGRIDGFPTLADRVIPGDLDNDRDIDLFVRLGDIKENGIVDTVQGPATTSFGFRYLLNDASAFEDLADVLMLDVVAAQDSPFSETWNRLVASEAMADFDNNGALDVFSSAGRAVFAEQVWGQSGFVNNPQTSIPDFDVKDPRMATDLLFLNGVDANGDDDPSQLGVLRELGNFGEADALLDYESVDLIEDEVGIGGVPIHRDTSGIWGIAAGDIDNDGDTDLVGAHHRFGTLTDFPYLLVNQYAQTGEAKFVDEWDTRVGPLDPNVIHSVTYGGKVLDDAMWPVLFDFDADGDLDIVYQVVNDLPRFLRNVGGDQDFDGIIEADEQYCPSGTFEDVTAEVLGDCLKVSVDSQEMMAVDVDLDGDLDLVNDPFFDMVTIWRNELSSSSLPVVTEIWPRIGFAPDPAPSASTPKLRLFGVNLTDVNRIQFRFADGSKINVDSFTLADHQGRQYLEFDLPYSATKRGLALVRLRAAPIPGVTQWSKQYFGYFVLGMAP